MGEEGSVNNYFILKLNAGDKVSARLNFYTKADISAGIVDTVTGKTQMTPNSLIRRDDTVELTVEESGIYKICLRNNSSNEVDYNITLNY